jgi:DNA-binding response OmpR family regulator
MQKERILIIEDDSVFLKSLSDYLKHSGFRVLEATLGAVGLQKSITEEPDIILLDWMLPDCGGPELCEDLRNCGFIKPIVLFTAREDQDSQVHGLNCGADAYWVKPVTNRIVLARIEALARRLRAQSLDGDTFHRGNWRVDDKTKTIYHKEQCLEFSFKEFGILRLLIIADEKPISRKNLLTTVWGFSSIPSTRTVDNYVVALRKKLQDYFGDMYEIKSVHRIGYRMACKDLKRSTQ